MADTQRSRANKGKGKARSLDHGGRELSARPAVETTPRRLNQQLRPGLTESSSGESSRTLRSRAAKLARDLCYEPVKRPRWTTVYIMSTVVFVLGVLRVFFLPGVKSGGGATAALPVMSAEREEELIRLVQAEQLGGILDRIQSEQRDVEELRTRHARAWDEWKFFAEAVEATAAELLELEALGRTVQEDYAGDAGLSTEVSRAQAGLEDLQRSVMESMDKFTKQLDQQAASLRRVDDAFSTAGDQATVDAYKEVERKLAEALSELGLFYTLAENDVAGLETGVDVLIARDLEELLRDKAAETYRNAATDTPPPQSSSKRKEENVSPHELIGRIARAEIDRVRLDKEQLVKKRNDSRRERGGDGGQECISEERLLEEVEEALENHAADGTGLRDFANKAIGGKVINSDALTSATFTPNGWLFPSTFMHKAGIENGLAYLLLSRLPFATRLARRQTKPTARGPYSIGPVDSVISEDSSLGRCWVMKGSVGRVTIRLPMEITVDGVSLEHASRMVTHESTSAPRDFEVYGLTNTDDRDPVRLTKGSYDLEGAPIQTFSVVSSSTTPFSIIRFEFLSNWGHPDYTCIYRVRVHGRETA